MRNRDFSSRQAFNVVTYLLAFMVMTIGYAFALPNPLPAASLLYLVGAAVALVGAVVNL